MEITARQLMAIQDAIGRNAEAKVILHEGHQWDYVQPVCIEVSAVHKGQKVYSRLKVSPYHDVPAVYIARRLVTGINGHIMDMEFNKEVFKG